MRDLSNIKFVEHISWNRMNSQTVWYEPPKKLGAFLSAE
jgi:hypothetical protein